MRSGCRLGNFTKKVEMSSQVVKLNLDCLELDKGGHSCSLGFNSLG